MFGTQLRLFIFEILNILVECECPPIIELHQFTD